MGDLVGTIRDELAKKEKKALEPLMKISHMLIETRWNPHIEKVYPSGKNSFYVCCVVAGGQKLVYLPSGLKIGYVEFMVRNDYPDMHQVLSAEAVRDSYLEHKKKHFNELSEDLESVQPLAVKQLAAALGYI